MKTKLSRTSLELIAYLAFLGISTLLIMELCFRFQVIEFYGAELKGLNPDTEISTEKENILVIGDSFSAHPESYVKYLRKANPDFNFINAAIPGTAIKQHNLIIKKRIEQFEPVHVIYQFYVGNDFADIDHPINFKTLSWARNLYWIISEKILFLQYLNYKLAFLKSHTQTIQEIHEPDFSAELYNNRARTYFTGDPDYLVNTIFLEGSQIRTWEKWKKAFLQFQENIPEDIPVSIVIIPHCAQVNTAYAERMEVLGAAIDKEILNINYPLYVSMEHDLTGVSIVNPLGKLQDEEKTGKHLYYSNDPHLTPEGQRYLGKYLIQNLNFTNEQ